MLNKIIHKIARQHHPWRKMKFDEMAEVYTSMSLGSFGFGVIGIFVPVFLYKNGLIYKEFSCSLHYSSYFVSL